MSAKDSPAACNTSACHSASAYLWEALSPGFRAMRKCNKWDEFVCGGYKQKHKLLDHRPRVTTMTDMSDDVDNIVREFLTKPYVEVSESLARAELKLDGPKEVDESNLARVQNYYRACLEKTDEHISERVFLELMDEVNRAFAKLDAVAPAYKQGNITTYVADGNTTHQMAPEDWSMLGKAQANLAQLGIYPFAKITVQKSLFRPNKMVISVVPNTEKAVPSKRWFDKKYDIWTKYWEQLDHFLEHAHGQRAPRVQDMRSLADRMTTLEEDLLNIRPKPRDLRMIKPHTGEMTLEQLGFMAPALRLNETIETLAFVGNATIDKVEVQWDLYFVVLHSILVRHSKEAIRSYVLWQAFLQTQDVWEMEWAKTWRNYSQNMWGTSLKPANLTLEEKCLARAQKHFGHILDSFYVRKEFSKRHVAGGEQMVARIRKEWMAMVNATEWMSEQGKNFTLDKLHKMKISIGYPGSPKILRPDSLAEHYSEAEVHYGKDTRHLEDDSPSAVYSLRRPDKWTHLHDYFNLERWYVEKAWKRLRLAPRSSDEWPVNALSQAPYYSHTHNKFILPAGSMRRPLWDPMLPSYACYAGLGSFIGQEMIKAVNGVGQQYQANGTIVGDTWTRKDWKAYNKNRGCYKWRWHETYDNGGRLYEYTLGNTWEAAMAENEGVEVAYRAWNSSEERAQDLWLPGFEVFSREELYWMARTLPYCGTERGGSWKEHYVLHGDKPPFWRTATEPLFDFYPFKRDHDCPLAASLSLFGPSGPADARLDVVPFYV